MIIKCRECDEPMTESKKGKPENLPPNVKWIICRQCDKGVEVIGDEAEDVGEVTAMSWQQTVTVTHWVTLKKTKDGVKRFTYSDKERTKLISEEDVN